MIVSLKKNEVCIQEYLAKSSITASVIEVLHFSETCNNRSDKKHSLTRAEEK